jgi:hypothetical protein
MRGLVWRTPDSRSMNPAYRPMLATLVDEPFDDKKWVFETKWDGFLMAGLASAYIWRAFVFSWGAI